MVPEPLIGESRVLRRPDSRILPRDRDGPETGEIMIDKTTLLASARREAKILKHLYARLPEGSGDYRPTPGQRSAAQLLEYLKTCTLLPTRCLLDGTWDDAEEHQTRFREICPAEFGAAIDWQMDQFEELIGDLSQEDLEQRETVFPWGEKAPLGRALLEMPVKFLTAYRMQLFLYAKAAGNDDLWTPDCWVGVDVARPARRQEEEE